MQKGRSDLRKSGRLSRSSSRASRRKGEGKRALLGAFLAMFSFVGVMGWPVFSLAADGDLKWAYTTGSEVSSSPALGADGTIYAGSRDHKLYAISPNGTLNWAYTTEGDVYSSPAIGTDGTIYVGSEDHKLYAINPNGTLNWACATGDDVYSSPALASDGTIYVGSRDHKLYAICGTPKLANTSWPMFHHDRKHTGRRP